MAAADASPPADLRGAWALKLSGAGFNWYRSETTLQADDVLVRTRAGASLTAALARLAEIERLFRHRHMPPPTRQLPFPDPGRVQELRRIEALRAQVSALETKVRGSPMPPADRVSLRHHDHEAVLARLVEADTDMVGAADDLATCLRGLDDQTILADAGQAACARWVGYVESALMRRAAIMA
jgi:hypothetical protein